VNFPSGQIWIEQAFYRGALGSPTTKGSKRILPLPKGLVNSLVRTFERAKRTGEDDLVFQTRNGTPFNDTSLLHQHLKPLLWIAICEPCSRDVNYSAKQFSQCLDSQIDCVFGFEARLQCASEEICRNRAGNS
jgi:hypothetical protein